jgi:hypothetical protein
MSQPTSYRPIARPVAGIPISLQHAADTWSKALLSARTNNELQNALDVVSKHPDAYSSGYSVASSARRRLTTELSQRLEKRLNQLNTTRKPQPLS